MEFCDICESLKAKEKSIAVIGLGYVGLPLGLSLSEYFSIIAFDTNKNRISELIKGSDSTGETDPSADGEFITYTSEEEKLLGCPLVIITVPTPVDVNKKPDLSYIKSALTTVGNNLHDPAVVVLESTVYPGVTEDISEEIFDKRYGLKRGEHYKLGYSPERINPGDKEHTLDKITKVISGDDEEVLSLLENVYGRITRTHKVSNIKTAETAKVIENIQRDLNIALMNELSIITDLVGVDTNEVVDAASTKWNFIPFRPGLVGGHCISVDPYYLTYLAGLKGYESKVILAGREINDRMGKVIVNKTVSLLEENNHDKGNLQVAVFGITFKENINDIRNSRVVDIVRELENAGIKVVVTDAYASKEKVEKEYGVKLVRESEIKNMNAIILAVAHKEYLGWDEAKILEFMSKENKPILIDVKSLFKQKSFENIVHWRL